MPYPGWAPNCPCRGHHRGDPKGRGTPRLTRARETRGPRLWGGFPGPRGAPGERPAVPRHGTVPILWRGVRWWSSSRRTSCGLDEGRGQRHASLEHVGRGGGRFLRAFVSGGGPPDRNTTGVLTYTLRGDCAARPGVTLQSAWRQAPTRSWRAGCPASWRRSTLLLKRFGGQTWCGLRRRERCRIALPALWPPGRGLLVELSMSGPSTWPMSVLSLEFGVWDFGSNRLCSAAARRDPSCTP